jgi:hypothetical protein
MEDVPQGPLDWHGEQITCGNSQSLAGAKVTLDDQKIYSASSDDGFQGTRASLDPKTLGLIGSGRSGFIPGSYRSAA